MSQYRKAPVALLSGGVGGARMARGFSAGVSDLTTIVNVGDDARIYGVHVAADLDTVMYTLAGVEGPHGWGRRGDTFTVMDHLDALGHDTTFRLGDADFALCAARTAALDAGQPLSAITAELCKTLGVPSAVVPATDDEVRTRVRLDDGWTSFQDYFVLRRHLDTVHELDFAGAASATPAPGVLDAIERAELVVIAPSNPPLSIWPILALGELAAAVRDHPRVIAVSPLFDGKALKGPAAEVMESLGLPSGNAGIVHSYEGLLDGLVIDAGDTADGAEVDVPVLAADTRIRDATRARRLASKILDWHP